VATSPHAVPSRVAHSALPDPLAGNGKGERRERGRDGTGGEKEKGE